MFKCSMFVAFAEEFEEKIFIRSLGELAKKMNELKDKGYLKKSDGSDYNVYEIPSTDSGSLLFPPDFLVDIELLVTFGLLYRTIKVQKYKEVFHQRYEMRISGWGRGYYERNLSNVQELNLYQRIKEYFVEILHENKTEYEELFEKVKEKPIDRDTSREVKGARAHIIDDFILTYP